MSEGRTSSPPTLVGTHTRRIALAIILVAQLAFFAKFVPKPPAVVQDNVRYEIAGWNLASGRGLSLPWGEYNDPDTREWACSRHAEACPGDLAPTAMYPPGYQLWIAAIYAVFGRSLVALVASQLALLLVMFTLFERVLAKRATTYGGYVFGVAVAASYPFLARQAGLVMSDHLHAALLFCSLAAFDLMRPGVRRALVTGLLFSMATLTRPYSVICIPFLFIVMAMQRDAKPGRIELAALAGAIALPIAIWAARNEVVFGRFIPFSTSGIGVSLFLNKLEWTIGSTLDPGNARPTYDELYRVGGNRDWTNWAAAKPLGEEGMAWMRANPGKVFLSLLARIPRLWVSMGHQNEGASRAWPLLVGYLGGLLALGVMGIWQRRKDRSTWVYAVVILTYWAFLLHTPAEARRTLPLRLPMILFAVYTMERLLQGRVGRAIERVAKLIRYRRQSSGASAASATPNAATVTTEQAAHEP